ncbi:MAG: hypothetical protein JJLCMIEE_03652 [Acidimicrobiales bacterium]|nr:hypothetical protein [Acidimicrobiales bacterium]
MPVGLPARRLEPPALTQFTSSGHCPVGLPARRLEPLTGHASCLPIPAGYGAGFVEVIAVLELLKACAQAIAEALGDLDDWGLAGTTEGQHWSDLAADAAALEVLAPAGVGILSEESGLRDPGRRIVVIIDPLDGSTNAARRLPWYATSLCAVDADGPLAAVVVNQATGVTYEATRGGGARRDGRTISVSSATELGQALVVVNGLPDRHWGWAQYRSLGAAALDLCAVADGSVDGYVDCSPDGLGLWDYSGGMLVLSEAGGVVADLRQEPLLELSTDCRRSLVAASTAQLQGALARARSGEPVL